MRFFAALAAALLLTPAVAWAQTVPSVTIEALPAGSQQLNISEIEADAPIRLRWKATVPGLDYRYALTIGRAVTEQDTSAAPFLEIDPDQDKVDGTEKVVSGRNIEVVTRPSRFIPAANLPGGSSGGVNDTAIKIVLKVYDANNETNDDYYAVASWELRYDTRPPAPPTVTELSPGENRLEVHWTDSTSSDAETYDVLYCPDVSGSSGELSKLPCDKPTEVRGLSGINHTSITKGLAVGVPAAVAMRTVDEFGNTGALGKPMVGTPIEVDDFMERYRAQGGTEDGGFCFIATAAYGSYAHPLVRVLRLFRDWVLLPTPPGAAFVGWYYAHSPPWADWIRQQPAARGLVQVALIPAALWAIVFMSAPLWGLGALLLGARRRRRQGVVVAGLLVGLALSATDASARPRPPPRFRAVGLGFEFKIGPYLPAMAEEGAQNSAFQDVFGAGKARPLFQLGMEFQVFRGFGTAAIGGSIGYMRWSGKALLPGTTTRTEDPNRLYVIPLALTAVYRFDLLADRTPIPLVPYLRAGLAYDMWWQTNGVGNLARFTNDKGDRSPARGGKLGYTGAIGLSFILNAVDPMSARKLWDSTGIRASYLFVEFGRSQVDGFGDGGFDFSDTTWTGGLMFEM